MKIAIDGMVSITNCDHTHRIPVRYVDGAGRAGVRLQCQRCGQTFVTLCLEMKRRGLRQWSSKAAFEAMRFMATLQSVGDDYKLPNDYTSRFSRKAMKEVPELDGFFEVRRLQDGACN